MAQRPSLPSQNPSSSRKKRDPVPLLLMVGTVLLAIYFIFDGFSARTREIGPRGQRQSEQWVDDRVNDHLKNVSKKVELETLKVEVQQLKDRTTAPALGERILPEPRAEHRALDMSPGRYEEQAFRDMQRNRPRMNAESPNYEMQSEVHDQDYMQQYDQAYLDEFAKQYVENARKQGYAVQLDENYVVRKVTPLRSAERYPNSESSLSRGKGAQ